MKLKNEILQILNDIENRIDEDVEDDYNEQWRQFLYGEFFGDIFTPKRCKTSQPTFKYHNISINDAVADYELMLISQLEGVSRALASTNRVLNMRANYGTGIMTSLFGAEVFIMPYHTDTLPTTRSLNDTEAIREILSLGIPDLENGFGKRVFEMGEIYAEILADYPKMKKYTEIYHPDTQGPLDICELLWGCEMFYAMYDDNDLVHGMLSLITETYKRFMDKWYEIHPSKSDINSHWSVLKHRGTVVLRDDSAMNLSPELYDEYARRYDAELLDYYDGGIIHFCGRGDHYIESMTGIDKLYGINMSQPHLNDMEKIYANTVDKDIVILSFGGDRAKADIVRANKFNHKLHV